MIFVYVNIFLNFQKFNKQFMRFKYDKNKSTRLKNNPKRNISFEEIQEIFLNPYYEDYRSDQPEQYRAIGWVKSVLYSVIYEIRNDDKGQYYHLITLWKSTTKEKALYEKNI